MLKLAFVSVWTGLSSGVVAAEILGSFVSHGCPLGSSAAGAFAPTSLVGGRVGGRLGTPSRFALLTSVSDVSVRVTGFSGSVAWMFRVGAVSVRPICNGADR